MSIPKRVTVSCPQCGKPFQTTIFDSVNTDFAKNIPGKVISGNLFNAKCPKCGFVSDLEYDILYHDLVHKAMIWVLNPDSDDYEKKMQEFRAIDILQYKVTRIVCDIGALREKVACLEAGKDDRVIELCKVFLTCKLIDQQPDFEFRNAFYTYVGGKEIVFFYDINGTELSSQLEVDVYNFVYDLFSQRIKDAPITSYQIVDSSWAEGFFELITNNDTASIAESDIETETITATPKIEVVTTEDPESTQQIFPKVSFCRKCGEKLLDDSIFCSYCGTKAG